MARATINGHVLAESDEFEVVEGNVYFPPSAVKQELFAPNPSHTICSWKGEASYYDIVVDGELFEGRAWFYPDPMAAAENIRDYVAFYSPPVSVER
ncbi:MAG: DUF427 domain-containing protein [Chloroflexi bacterium]|nr:DUF427 domain-containing protein [Chloroflexota bacterium]MDA1145444.1 DUF427 domain-containing protein [Chloroflexota bacterium]